MDWERIGEWVAIAVGGGTLAGLGSWLIKLLNEWRDMRAKGTEAKRIERKDAIAELSDIIARLNEELVALKAKVDRALANELDCERKWNRAISYIEYIGFQAQREGWPIRPWSEHGTDIHQSLNSIPPVERRVSQDPGYPGPERRKGDVDLHGPDDLTAPDAPDGSNEG